MKIKRILFALLFLVPLLACEKNAEISTPKKYNKEGISFNYPSNWEITEDAFSDGVYQISVETPGNAIFLMMIYKETNAVVPLDKFSKLFSEAFAEVLFLGKSSTSSFTPVTRVKKQWNSAGIREKFDISILKLVIPYEREFHSIKKSGKVGYLISQAEVEEMPHVEPGFNLIRETFLIE
jgi:hypothetical protein